MSIARLLPFPLTSLAILALWMVLATQPSVGQFLLGGLIAITVPWFTREFWPERPRVHRPVRAARLAILVLMDIVLANWQVARLVLGPMDRLRPAFIELPLDIEDPFVATILGSIISLTPGTVSIDIDRERRHILVHTLDVDDPGEMIATIKNRYEAPLKEIFQC
jgi:multicomponent K+:H+ antiporter subunit E